MAGSRVLEGDLRKIMRDPMRFPSGTLFFGEFGHGGDPGLPDAWLAGNSRWLPLELKKGNSVVKALRPSQRKWHRESLERGIATYGATIRGVGSQNVLIVRIVLVGSTLMEEYVADIAADELTYDWLRIYLG